MRRPSRLGSIWSICRGRVTQDTLRSSPLILNSLGLRKILVVVLGMLGVAESRTVLD
jgi:hypothetical protein